MSQMINDIEAVIQDLNRHMGRNIEVSQDKYHIGISTDVDNLLTLLGRLKEVHDFNYLANLTAVDYLDFIEVIYHINSIPENRRIMVKVRVNREEAIVPSAVSLWPGADWQERELYDLMGIRFQNHPNLTRILLPDDFEGYPLRKDFQVKG